MTISPPPSRLRLDTSPPLREVEEGSEATLTGSLPHPPVGGEVAARSDDGVGAGEKNRSRRKAGTTTRARSLRKGGNQAEAMLWLELKGRKLAGHQFTRQFPIGPYFADFCCRKNKLVVELDGSQHADSSYDRRRDEFMRQAGYSTLRFWSHEALKCRRAVCDTILAALDGQLTEDVTAPDLRFSYARKADSVSHYRSPSP